MKFPPRWLSAMGSLYLAAALLVVCIVALAAATLVESRLGAAQAHAWVYGAGWFAALLAVFGLNVAAAMAARLPWRKRHFGFVATHAGVLALLCGALATRQFGVEAQLSIFEGRAAHRAAREGDQGDLELGFQVRLIQFRRKLDPGAEMASHYSSLVDILDRAEPPNVIRQNVLIALNAPVDVVDPATKRTYRLFQSSFDGPWKPGQREFDELAEGDRRRDQVYLSRLSVNYDPGRGLKYLGSLLVVVGILVVYYLRRWFVPKTALSIVFVFCAIGASPAAEAPAKMDWSTWRRLPCLGAGRIVPLDTFARENVEAICGRTDPVLTLDGQPARRYSAAELIFLWMAEPARWETAAFLAADDPALRRDVLGLPLHDAQGNRLRYISPVEVENHVELGRRWAKLQARAEAEGEMFRLTPLDHAMKKLVEAYGRYRQLTFDPDASKEPPQRFYNRLRQASDAWRKLAVDLHAAKRISRDESVRQGMVDAGQALKQLMAQIHADDGFPREKLEPTVDAFCRASRRLASLLVESPDRPTAALAAELARQSVETHLAMYDNGRTLRLVPSLNSAALEENRLPGDDASPWLSFRALISGGDALLRDYPQPELLAVRAAWNDLKTAYARRSGDFAAAMDRWADALQNLARRIEPLRDKLSLQYRDEELIRRTAYPPVGATRAEVFYNRLDPFFWAWTISLAAVLCFLMDVGPWRKGFFWLGAAVLLVGQSFAALGLGLRGWILGLVPLTGMFETVVFVAFYSSLLGLWFSLLPLLRRKGWAIHCPATESVDSLTDQILQRRPFALAGALVGFAAMALAYYAPASVMHRNLGAVAPILRDNFWLAVHVATIMASYASAVIALVLGNIVLGYCLFGSYVERRPPEICRRLAGFIYAAIRITVLLLAAGTVLGALWADKAWGRYWGWDPKEVWALISLLVYLLILHIRHIGRAGDFGMAVAAVLGATSILFTWYGVNFVLGAGLHSYGSGAGGQWAVASAVAVNWLWLGAAAARKWRNESWET